MEANLTAAIQHPAINSDDPLAQFIAGQLSEQTKRAYYSDLCQFFGTHAISTETIRAVTFADVISFRNNLAASGLKRSTINRKLASLKSFFKMLVAAGFIENNPADSALVRGYRIEDTLSNKAISTKVLQEILQSIEEDKNELARARDAAIVMLLTYGGLRRSEAAHMSWGDISQEGAFFILTLPATKAGVPQVIKLQPVVAHYLKNYREILQRNGYDTNGRVFISLSPNLSHGKPLTDQSINLIVKKRAKKAGVPHQITAHMFRHTCCTLAIEGGAKPQQVQAHLRHKDLKTTMRYYENRENLVNNASDYIRLS